MMSVLFDARAQTGTSLAFHIIIASFGVGIPLFLLITEGLWLKTGEQDWLILTKRWTKYFGVLFPIGAVSGTILSFELGLLWPTFMQFSGDIIGLPFALEGFAFFIEAIFLGLYIYGWNRLTPIQHWLTSVPLAISGAASAWFVVSANSWMNSPSGFEYKNGVLTGINPVEAIFNPSTPTETIHMLLAAYEVTAFGIAMMFAFGILRGRSETWMKKGLLVSMLLGTIVAPLQIISGDASARAVAQLQPAKLAAMEALYHTTAGAPLSIGGIPNNATQTNSFAIEIPKGLSILINGDPNSTVTGLDTFPEPLRPNPALVHPFFDMMVGIGFLMLLVTVVFWFLWYRGKKAIPSNKWLLRSIIASGPLTVLALEFGWMVTEEGRQPWVIQGILLTKNAVTTAPGVDVAFAVFSFLYVVLGVVTIYLLRRFDDTKEALTKSALDSPAK